MGVGKLKDGKEILNLVESIDENFPKGCMSEFRLIDIEYIFHIVILPQSMNKKKLD